MKLRRIFILCIAVFCLVLASSCEQKRKSRADWQENEKNAANPSENADSDNITVSQLMKREGKTPENSNLAQSDASSSLPQDSWANDPSSKGGMFLVAGASVAGSAGGDMIRRIDLKNTPTEFDYDDEKPGAQGALVYVPDEFKKIVSSGLIDGESMFKGSFCAFVPGPNKQLFAIANGGGNDPAVAFLIDPYEKAVAFTPKEAYAFPLASDPCRAFYSEEFKKLYVIDVSAAGFRAASEGIYVAKVGNGVQVADFYAIPTDKKPNPHSVANFSGINMYKGVLYLLSANARFDNDWDTGVYRVPLNTEGEPLVANLTFARANNPVKRVPNCALGASNIVDSIIVDNGKPTLLTGGTEGLVAWDISGDEPAKLDLNDKKPGVQPLVKTDKNGMGVPTMLYDPTGKKIYALHHCHSSEVFQAGETSRNVFNISVLDPKEIKSEPASAVDMAYQKMLKSMTVKYYPNFTMTTRSFAVGTNHIGIVGAASSNNSGLGASADVMIVSLKDGGPIAFAKPSDPKEAHTIKYGFKLAKGDKAFDRLEQNGRAIVWLP